MFLIIYLIVFQQFTKCFSYRINVRFNKVNYRLILETSFKGAENQQLTYQLPDNG
jgi:hypothetical protein